MEIDPTSSIQEMVEQCNVVLTPAVSLTDAHFDTSRLEWDDGLDDARPCICHPGCRRSNELRRDYEVCMPTRIASQVYNL